MDNRIVSASGDTQWNWPCLHLRGGELVTATVSWTNEAGTKVQLPPGETSAVSTGTATVVVKYMPGEASAILAATIDEATIADDELVIEDWDTSLLSGCYRAQMQLFDENGALRLSLPFLISVESDVFSVDTAKSITIADIRMFLYDRLAAENVVEGGQEFPDRLLFDALCQAVKMYNQAPPSGWSKNVRTFTEHGPLLEGVAATVYGSYASLLARNRLAVPGQADAEQRISMYSEFSRMYKARWLGWIAEHKRVLDADDGWGEA